VDEIARFGRPDIVREPLIVGDEGWRVWRLPGDAWVGRFWPVCWLGAERVEMGFVEVGEC
jgi:hypothetical protein